MRNTNVYFMLCISWLYTHKQNPMNYLLCQVKHKFGCCAVLLFSDFFFIAIHLDQTYAYNYYRKIDIKIRVWMGMKMKHSITTLNYNIRNAKNIFDLLLREILNDFISIIFFSHRLTRPMASFFIKKTTSSDARNAF